MFNLLERAVKLLYAHVFDRRIPLSGSSHARSSGEMRGADGWRGADHVGLEQACGSAMGEGAIV